MRPVNPTLVILRRKPKRCEGRVNEGDMGYVTHVGEGDAESCLGVKFPACHIWLDYNSIGFLVQKVGVERHV